MTNCTNGNCKNGAVELVALRHGQSTWEKRFCGWYNADLTEKGLGEAIKSANLMKEKNFKFDIAFSSALNRAKITLDIILKELGQSEIPRNSSWKLNERHYGALTGLNKVETAEKYGEDKVQTWRRSYNVLPPPMEEDHPFYCAIRSDPIYKDVSPEEFPKSETLELTIKRMLPYWEENIVPHIRAGKRVLIVAHGTSLRGIVKTLDDVSEEDIRQFNIPTGMPFYYTLDSNLKPVKGLEFLGDPDAVKKAMEDVKNQIKK